MKDAKILSSVAIAKPWRGECSSNTVARAVDHTDFPNNQQLSILVSFLLNLWVTKTGEE